MTKKKINILIALGIVGIFILGGFGAYEIFKNKKDTTVNNSVGQTEGQKQESNNIKISFVGDILVHQKQLDSAKNPSTGEYNFTEWFKFVKDKIQSADYAVANLETTLAGPEKGFSGYPTFNTPDTILDALKDTGFDMVSVANNHINDSGQDGLLRTVNTVKDSGLAYMGVRPSTDEKNYSVQDIKGVKVGFINYVFETAKMNGHKSLNSIPLNSTTEALVNSFNPANPEEDYPAMKEAIDSMKADGAEFIVFSMHWGEEYQVVPNNTQKEIAQKIADLGANLIIGGHPHVLQPVDIIQSGDGREVPIFYSLGNFVSNQRYEELASDPEIGDKAYRTEEGMIASIDISKDSKTSEITIKDVSYTPTWVDREKASNGYKYEVVPSGEADKSPDKFEIKDSSFVSRMRNSFDSIVKSMGSMTSSKLIKAPSEE